MIEFFNLGKVTSLGEGKLNPIQKLTLYLILLVEEGLGKFILEAIIFYKDLLLVIWNYIIPYKKKTDLGIKYPKMVWYAIKPTYLT